MSATSSRPMSVPDTLSDEEMVRLELISLGTASIDASEVAGSPYCKNGKSSGMSLSAPSTRSKGKRKAEN